MEFWLGIGLAFLVGRWSAGCTFYVGTDRAKYEAATTGILLVK